jgi:hypothetical protein
MLDVLWNKYTRDTFELLDKSESTLQVPDFFTVHTRCSDPDPRGSTLILVGSRRAKMNQKNGEKVKIR